MKRMLVYIILALVVIGGIYTALKVEAIPLRQPTTIPATCTSNAQCSTNEFCEFPPGQCGGIGHCTFTPTFCTGIYDPVCGCNAATYSNDCYRAIAKISLKHLGVC